MLDETLLITASKAARGITAAQAAVDEAKRLVEEAKLGVEAAKAGLAEAKASYDAVISEIAGSGVPASKARKAVDDMLRIFAEVGIIDTPSEEVTAEAKAPRRKKAEAAPVPAPAEIAVALEKLSSHGEPGVIIIGEAADQEATTAEAAPLPNGDAAASAEAADVSPSATIEVTDIAIAETEQSVADVDHAEVASPATSAEIDNQEALREIYDIVVSSTDGEDLFVSETLIAMLNAAEWYSREHRGEPLSLDLYREILNVDFAAEAVTTQGLAEEIKGGLEMVVEANGSEKVFEWFLHVLGKLEDGKTHPGYSEFFSMSATEAPAALAVASAAVGVEEDDISDELLADEFIADPEVDVSDDETLAVDTALVGEDVTDIEEINFLEPSVDAPAAPVETPTAEVQAASTDDTASAAAGPRRFARPSFLPKK